MNVMAALGEMKHSRQICWRTTVKRAAAFAMLVMILTGAGYFLVGGHYGTLDQVIAGLVGALLGAGSAWWSSQPRHK
jgi:hypothetical protein